jgi:hypothetical protein
VARRSAHEPCLKPASRSQSSWAAVATSGNPPERDERLDDAANAAMTRKLHRLSIQ